MWNSAPVSASDPLWWKPFAQTILAVHVSLQVIAIWERLVLACMEQRTEAADKTESNRNFVCKFWRRLCVPTQDPDRPNWPTRPIGARGWQQQPAGPAHAQELLLLIWGWTDDVCSELTDGSSSSQLQKKIEWTIEKPQSSLQLQAKLHTRFSN
jgi:hypothetical protein